MRFLMFWSKSTFKIRCGKFVVESSYALLDETTTEQDTIVDVSELYEQIEETIEEITQPITSKASSDFLNYISSLTPFYYLKLPIPLELLTSSLITSFCENSTYQQLTDSQWEELLVHSLNHANVNCVKIVLSAICKTSVAFNLLPYLENPYFKLTSVFPNVFKIVTRTLKPKSFATWNSSIVQYVKNFTGNNLAQFVLNVTTNRLRAIATALLKFDFDYFTQEILSIKQMKRFQLINLLHYCGNALVRFSPNDFLYIWCVYYQQHLIVIKTTIKSTTLYNFCIYYK